MEVPGSAGSGNGALAKASVHTQVKSKKKQRIICRSPQDTSLFKKLKHKIFVIDFSTFLYIPAESKASYQSKDENEKKASNALIWLAAIFSHVPNNGDQMIQYYEYYNNVSLSKRKSKPRGKCEELISLVKSFECATIT